MLHHIAIASISLRTYYKIQRAYLVPAVFRVWQARRNGMVEEARREHRILRLAGDGRCDSPGHNAKYGTYSLLDLDAKKIIALEVVQCNEVTSSNAMEREGLVRCMEGLDENGLEVQMLVTDRHASVRKYMREERGQTLHFFDVWHMSKGLKKKVLAAAKKRKANAVLVDWWQTINNHLYWCALTSGGDQALVRAKWLSLLRHVCDIHEGHGEPYDQCAHGDLPNRDWLNKGSVEYKALAGAVTEKRFVTDIGLMSPDGQTAGLEAFHSVLIYFAPKSRHFFFSAMRARCLLAALHFNENSGRLQQVSDDGNLRWYASYPKHRGGDGVLKKVKAPCTYGYVHELLEVATSLRDTYPSYRKAEVLGIEQPPLLTQTMDVVEKDDLIARHMSRFIE